MKILMKPYIIIFILLLTDLQYVIAGPPFDTDDPEPVDFKHWEYYISSINNHQGGVWSGTAPHFETNYGAIPNVQIHLLMPFNYNSPMHQRAGFGYADTEFGIKYRFVKETDNRPMIGAFPIIEIPTVRNSEFSSGKAKIYLPLWLQKSWGNLMTYGGVGYWINPGVDNKNWVFSGWELQYTFSPVLMLGGEVYYHTTDVKGGKPSSGINLGGSVNPSEKFHFIFSVGHTITSDNAFTSYIGLLWTI
jgi:hypothetical protein